MRTPVASSSALHRPPTKQAGDEVLPGYRLTRPLGQGGFGEVWECEAPGGLSKAIKFVYSDPNQVDGGISTLQQEYEAFQEIKAVRHPFLLTLERVELVGHELIMVMELADQQLQDRYAECRKQGRAGIPRDELIGYLADAAEALDVIAAKHRLQHLDVKPANLFLVGGRVKVGDFGLVGRLQAAGSRGRTRGLTPQYVAPEVLRGQVDTRSDQYSLALVYQALLTGAFPYPATTAEQLLLQHLSVAPDLSPLPPEDREAVSRALSKQPINRFPTCLEFIKALLTGMCDAAEPVGRATSGSTVMSVRHARLSRSPEMTTPPPIANHPSSATPTEGAMTVRNLGREGPPPPLVAPSTRSQVVDMPTQRVPTPKSKSSPFLDPIDAAPVELTLQTVQSRQPAKPAPAPPPPPTPIYAGGTVLEEIGAVVSTAVLRGGRSATVPPTSRTVIDTILSAARGNELHPANDREPVRRPDGSWLLRFPLRAMPGMVQLKMDVIREEWGSEVNVSGPQQYTIRRYTDPGLFGRLTMRRPGIELQIKFPDPGQPAGEVEIIGKAIGSTDAGFLRDADPAIVVLIEALRKHLHNMENRRRFPRISANFAVTLYPINDDGVVAEPVPARATDVSAGGISCLVERPLKDGHFYLTVDSVPGVEGWALLTRIVRTEVVGERSRYGGEFLTDS